MPPDKLRLIYQNDDFCNDLLQKAVQLATEGDHRAALPLLKELVDDGESVANCYLGLIYEYGYADVPANHEYARFYYERAVEDGWVPGCIGLGRIYYYGLGIEQNLQRAFEYFHRIHEAKVVSPIADFYLGQIFQLGEGTDRNRDRAIFFFERSSRQGYLWARSRLAKMVFDEGHYLKWIRIRLSLLFGTICVVARQGTKTWHTALPTSTMGPSSLTFG